MAIPKDTTNYDTVEDLDFDWLIIKTIFTISQLQYITLHFKALYH
jgi:hypothetical protein